MTSDDGLAVVLTVQAEDLYAHRDAAEAAIEAARRTESKLDELLRRARALSATRRKKKPRPTLRAVQDAGREMRRPPVDWDELRTDSLRRCEERGIDPSRVQVDDLLEPETVERIEQRFLGGFRVQTNLDRYDVLAAVGAGLVASLVDFFLARIPKDTVYRSDGLRNDFLDRASPLTKWLQKDPWPHDNWLSTGCKVPFDRVKLKQAGAELPGSGGRTHRYHTLGHDPLLGLVFGTIDIIRGGLTGIDRNGNVVSASNLAPQEDPITALFVEILHLLSDSDTRMGLPAPGWTATGLLQFGSIKFDAIGPEALTIGELARQMYVAGFDSRHFLTMTTSPAAAAAVLRGYWGFRKILDDEFREEVDHAADLAGAHSVADHPRYQGLSLIAHLIGSAANAGKIALYKNPLAFNYAQWLAFVNGLLRFAKTQMRSPTEVLVAQSKTNLRCLASGWPDVDWTDNAPRLGKPPEIAVKGG